MQGGCKDDQDNNSPEAARCTDAWRMLFLIEACILLVSAMLFMLVSAEPIDHIVDGEIVSTTHTVAYAGVMSPSPVHPRGRTPSMDTKLLADAQLASAHSVLQRGKLTPASSFLESRGYMVLGEHHKPTASTTVATSTAMPTPTTTTTTFAGSETAPEWTAQTRAA